MRELKDREGLPVACKGGTGTWMARISADSKRARLRKLHCPRDAFAALPQLEDLHAGAATVEAAFLVPWQPENWLPMPAVQANAEAVKTTISNPDVMAERDTGSVR